jgi:tRNA nucleotidyltransferase/poly(A) polymerase
MPDFTNLPYPDVLTILHDLTPEGYSVYLVGGSVRDLLLNEPIHDLDFAVEGDPFVVGRRLANKLNAAFFIMDEVHPTCRVLYRLPDQTILTIDFAALRAGDLKSDLDGRDFTFNSIAIALDNPGRLIDPLGGAQDLKDKTLKACCPTAFSDDPIRVLRAIRQALQFHVRIQSQSLQWIRQAAPELCRTSPERQRDELFKMLTGTKPAAALRLLNQFGADSVTLPELGPLKTLDSSPPQALNSWEHTLATLHWLDAIFEVLVGPYQPSSAANLNLGLAVLRLGRYRDQLAAHFNAPITVGRSRRSLLFFAALYHHVGKPTIARQQGASIIEHEKVSARLTNERARQLALSQGEIRLLEALITQQGRIHHMVAAGGLPDCLSTYHYFRDLNAAGIDLCFLSLADTLATYMASLQQDRWTYELDICRHLMEAWWEKKSELVDPPRLVSGHDLISHFNLTPGPSIGMLLEAIRESQVCDQLNNKETALEFAANWLENQG